MFPLNPGQKNFLSANMGELRPNHFHAGIDVKTGFAIGLPVYAAQDGYLSRVRVSSYGYGNTIYITHPNGLVTVYAHLDSFSPVIKSYVLDFQYKSQAFELDEYVAKDLIQVKKGDIIGKSGNSGSSGGPHLHFEIRDSLENVLNPLLFGFSEIKDNLPPIIQKIAARPLEINSRVEQEYALKEWLATKKPDGSYQIPGVIEASGNIGLEIKVTDKMNETSNLYGVNCIELFVNGEEIFYHNVESFSFDESKYINVHIDYAHFVSKHQRLERLYVADGNRLSTYKKIKNRGRLSISPGETKQIEVRVYDAFGNKSVLKCSIKGVEPKKDYVSTSALAVGSKVDENTLIVACPALPNEKASLFMKGKKQEINPAYRMLSNNVYLYDLRKGLPDSIAAVNYKENFNFVSAIPPGKDITVGYKTLTLSFADTTLFDTLYLQAKIDVIAQNHETFEISSTATPVFGKINVRYCPEDKGTEIGKCYIYSANGSNTSHRFEGGEWNENNILYDIKYLGKFAIRRDTI
ncbi:MAG: M23 family metallopeptidase, partial [Cytophagaceae bacterium]|nr:M23 family metallopeptidase [Cytophagaceae bacterium]